MEKTSIDLSKIQLFHSTKGNESILVDVAQGFCYGLVRGAHTIREVLVRPAEVVVGIEHNDYVVNIEGTQYRADKRE